ncbi:hypothetical protein MKK58_17655 [Methylobacterium sp. J-078]|uniref:hypothetical protein n=1 Tax=Methylobacterium sp. J-078 TaxID=2836657 RepID=UPI001FBB6757|nr:hypothetical protein [Methylobacterium sp. J-078]MCJ2046344.1 hypothetical protein [Methylobacterium sp. J-078]
MIDPTLAPVWDYLASTIRGYRIAGTCDARVGVVLEDYVGHAGRLVRDRHLTLSEGLVLANRAVRAARDLHALEEARRAPR